MFKETFAISLSLTLKVEIVPLVILIVASSETFLTPVIEVTPVSAFLVVCQVTEPLSSPDIMTRVSLIALAI